MASDSQHQSTGQEQERRRGLGRPRKGATAAWDDATSALLLRLRFDEMQELFAACENTFATAQAWVQLANELNARTQRSANSANQRFDSQQCQNKLKMLRKKWIAAVPAAVRTRDDANEIFLRDSLHRLTVEKEPRGVVWRPASVSGGVQPSPPPAEDAENESEQQQLKQEYASLYRRHLAALECIAQSRAEKAQLKKQKLALAKERLVVARDQWEVSLFSAQHGVGDSVSREFLALKRKQVRDRLRRERYPSSSIQSRSAQLPLATVTTGLPAPAAQFHAVSGWMNSRETSPGVGTSTPSSRRRRGGRIASGIAL